MVSTGGTRERGRECPRKCQMGRYMNVDASQSPWSKRSSEEEEEEEEEDYGLGPPIRAMGALNRLNASCFLFPVSVL